MARSRSTRFRRLGVDVWVRRGTGAERAAVAETESTAESAALPAAPSRAAARPSYGQAAQEAGRESAAEERATRPSRVAPQAPRAATKHGADAAARSPETPLPAPFHIRCFHFGDVFAAIGEDAWPQRRLLLDVALALNKFRTAERQDVLFSWPQPGADPNGGDRAFRAFFAHRVPGEGVALISGARVSELLGRTAPSDSGWLESRDEDPPALYVAPRTLDANAKRALWALAKRLA